MLLLLNPNKSKRIYDLSLGSLPEGMTFFRASNAMETDSTGTPRFAPANMAFPSVVNSGTWSVSGASIANNAAQAPDGTNTAALVTDGSTTSFHITYLNGFPAVAGQIYTRSIYAKAGTQHWIQQAAAPASFGDNAWANFDLLNGVVGTKGSAAIAGIESVADYAGWYRCWITVVASASGTVAHGVVVLTDNTDSATRYPSYTGTGGGVYLWGLQTELTSYNSPQAYNPATSAAYYGSRFDYDPATLASKGLLIEGQRTNKFLNSDTPATQDITVTVEANTLSFSGTGSITLSGTATGTVTGTGVFPARKTYTFTPTAGTLTLTVSGTVEKVQLESGSFATSYIPTCGAAVTRAADVLSFTIPNGVTRLKYIFDNGSSQLVPVTPGSYTVPTTLNRSWIKQIVGFK